MDPLSKLGKLIFKGYKFNSVCSQSFKNRLYWFISINSQWYAVIKILMVLQTVKIWVLAFIRSCFSHIFTLEVLGVPD